MAFERFLAQRLELFDELLSHDVGERRGDTDVVECAFVVIEAEQQGADHCAYAVLVPAEARGHTIGRARVLDLDHAALAGAVGRIQALGHDAVQSGALETTEPVLGEATIARGW